MTDIERGAIALIVKDMRSIDMNKYRLVFVSIQGLWLSRR